MKNEVRNELKILLVAIIASLISYIMKFYINNIVSITMSTLLERKRISLIEFKIIMYGYQIIYQLLIVVLTIIFFNIIEKRKTNFIKNEIKNENIKNYLPYIILAFFLIITELIFSLINAKITYKMIFDKLSIESSDSKYFKFIFYVDFFQIYKNNGIFGIIMQCIILPIITVCLEEYVWRYKYFKIVKDNNKLRLILFNSLSFSIIHLINGYINILFVFFITFFILAPLYLKYNNIKLNIVFHLCVDMFIIISSFILTILNNRINIVSKFTTIENIWIFILAIFFIVPLILLFSRKAKLYMNNII